MSELGKRPSTTCGYHQKLARKAHRCKDCCAEIKKGALYVQDDYYAPYGNGARYCLRCAKDNEQAETEWALAFDTRKVVQP